MIDFISATISGCKDTINFSHLVLEGENIKYNRTYYAIEGCEEMKIIIMHNTGDIRLKGSVPYFFQGNNFTLNGKLFTVHAPNNQYEFDDVLTYSSLDNLTLLGDIDNLVESIPATIDFLYELKTDVYQPKIILKGLTCKILF